MKSLLCHAARGLNFKIHNKKRNKTKQWKRQEKKKRTRTNQRHKIDLFISLDQFVFEDKRLKSATIKVSLEWLRLLWMMWSPKKTASFAPIAKLLLIICVIFFSTWHLFRWNQLFTGQPKRNIHISWFILFPGHFLPSFLLLHQENSQKTAYFFNFI